MITPAQIQKIVEEAVKKWGSPMEGFLDPEDVIEEAILEALRIERMK